LKQKQKKRKKESESKRARRAYPVEYVEGAVGAEEENVVPVEVFDFPEPLQDDELGDDSQRLEENRKRPQNLERVKVIAAP
jgi:hypothetical protein